MTTFLKELLLLPFLPFRLGWRWTRGLALQTNAKRVCSGRGGVTEIESQPVRVIVGGRVLTTIGIAVVLYALLALVAGLAWLAVAAAHPGQTPPAPETPPPSMPVAEPPPEPRPAPQPLPEAKPDPEPEVKPQPAPRPEPIPEAKPEPVPEAKPDPEPSPQPEPAPARPVRRLGIEFGH